uniref:Uncharacterized protein LOC111122080 n=1 Tax=Crassostrea virginica TaxID=6565 RepID=A0A8B8CU58_CRAVI|nr:uncharacterized protein LOC111122080 [Crassostrea virginica]
MLKHESLNMNEKLIKLHCFLRFALICLLPIFIKITSIDANGVVYFQDFVPSVIDRHIKSSRHLPVCILFRRNATKGSKLEKYVYSLWKNEPSGYKDWQFGSYSFDKNEMLSERRPDFMPAVKCYLGQSSSYLYEGEAKKSLVHQWLSKLVDKHAEQLQDATQDLIEAAIKTHNVTILAFPDHHNHHHVEEKVFQLSETTSSCKAFVVHPYSIHANELKEYYKVPDIPAILVIVKDDKNWTTTRLFSRQHIQTKMLESISNLYKLAIVNITVRKSLRKMCNFKRDTVHS